MGAPTVEANQTDAAHNLRASLLASMAINGDPFRASRKPPEAIMAEPAYTAGGAAAWTSVGGVTGVAGICAGIAAGLGTAVAMCMMTPRSPREWAVGITSSVVSSFGGGAYVLLKMGLHRDLPADPVSLYLALMAMAGVIFTCALPGWAIVRAGFTWLERRKDKDLGEMIQDAKKAVTP